MPDLMDQAAATADLFLTTALTKSLKAATAEPRGIGVCLWCGEEVDEARRWCDASCRDEFEADQRRSGR